MAIPFFSVLIVNYNGRGLLQECLDALASQSFRDFETVLVDNASRDDSVEFVKAAYPWVKVVLSERNLGFGGGNNLGYPHCRGRFIYFLNTDAIADKGALAALAAAIETNPSIGVYQSFLIQHGDRSRADSAGDTVYSCGKNFTFRGYPVSMFSRPRLITSACAGAAVFSRRVLDKIGLFDEDYFLNYEDVDLSFRAQHAGEKILFVPDSRVYHYGSVSQGGKKSPLAIFYAERNFLLFVLKNFPLPCLIRLIPAIFFVKAWGFCASLWFRCPQSYFLGNLAFLRLIPGLAAKRGKILSSSILTPKEFQALLRRNWLREKIAYVRGRFDIPL